MQREEEHFCRYLAVRLKRAGSYIAGTKIGFPSPHLAWIHQGSCQVEYGSGKVLLLGPGDVWFIPKGLPYVSRWSAENEVVFDKLEFEADYFSLYYRTMQVLHLPELRADFSRLCAKGESDHSFGSLAAFYHILDTLIPLLKKEKNDSIERILPALRYICEWDSASIRVDELAQMCYMSPSRFYEVFREAVGDSPINYKNQIRLSHAKMLIQEGMKIEEVCERLQFSSPSFLRRMIKRHLGTTPKELRQGRSI